ncbi:hypothetical protein [Neptunomonas sp. XY-337]|uniref:hypothetical protein n=1 Tax=Neptunomonas sp. XY-337 TaxID=2561897 RepID=UPI0010AA870C|nr:hypothetical protein [Neptunomonas sp. XY-337]
MLANKGRFGVYLSLLILVGCQVAPNHQDLMAPVSAAELSDVLTKEPTFTWRTKRISGVSHFYQGGALLVNWGKGDIQGTWNFRDDALCLWYDVKPPHTERCYQLYRDEGGEYHLFSDEQWQAKGVFR